MDRPGSLSCLAILSGNVKNNYHVAGKDMWHCGSGDEVADGTRFKLVQSYKQQLSTRLCWLVPMVFQSFRRQPPILHKAHLSLTERTDHWANGSSGVHSYGQACEGLCPCDVYSRQCANFVSCQPDVLHEWLGAREPPQFVR